MPHRYRMHVFCNECSEPHPTPIVVKRGERLAADQSVGDIYDGVEVPAEIVTMLGNSFRCPNTGKMFTQHDNYQVFFVLIADAPPPPITRGISFNDDLT